MTSISKSYKIKAPNCHISNSSRMSLSKHVTERINKVEDSHVPITIPIPKILEVCKVTYKNAISIEIIHNLLGGENMEYNIMEVDNSFECHAYCRQDLLDNLKQDKRDICYFEDRKNSTSNSSCVSSNSQKPRQNGNI